MKIYKSTDNNGISSHFDCYTDVLEEFKMFLDNALEGDVMSYEIIDMTEEDFKSLQA